MICDINVSMYHVSPERLFGGTEHSKQITKLSIHFDSTWDEFPARRITFYPARRNPVISIIPESGEVDLPNEVTSAPGICQYVISGITGARMIVTRRAAINIADTNNPDGTAAQTPTQSEIQQVYSYMQSAISAVNALVARADGGEFKGDTGYGLDFIWDGTKLGVKTENEDNYTYTDLKGKDGADVEFNVTSSLELQWRYANASDTWKTLCDLNDLAPDVEIGTVTTLDPGSDATGSITVSNGKYVLDLSIPAGYDGENNYLHIRYSHTSPAADSDVKTASDDYIGVAVSDSESAPTAYTAYQWQKVGYSTEEAARESAESSRVSAESARVTQESARASAESGRVSSEQLRVTAESGRVSAEIARQSEIAKLQGMSASASTLSSGAAATAALALGDDGKYHLNLGLPRGEQGIKGDTGAGFKVLGKYASLSALQAAVTSPEIGDAYSVGAAATYDIYIYSATGWVNHGKLQGAKGEDGADGADGTTFIPSVDASGNLSWSNADGKQNPATVNVKGAKGDKGAAGAKGEDGSDASVTKANVEAVLTGDITSHSHTKVNGHSVLSDVPANAAFTDTTYAAATTAAAGLMSSTDKSKLDGIETAADVSVNADWNATEGKAQILNKPTIPEWAQQANKPSYTAAEVSAVPTTRTVNSKALSANVTLTASDVSAVPTARTINGKALSANVTLEASDVGLANVDNVKQMPISGGALENYREKLVTLSGTSTAINLSLGNVFTHTLSGNTTYSITNAVNGQAHSFTLIINMGSTVRTLTFPASVKWQGGEIPDLSTASKTYVLTFVTVDGGATWFGMFGGEF